MVQATDEILLATILKAEIGELRESLRESFQDARHWREMAEQNARHHLMATEYKRAMSDILYEEFLTEHDPATFGERQVAYIAIDRSDWLPSMDAPFLVVVEFEVERDDGWETVDLQFWLVELKDGTLVYEASRVT